MAGDIFDVFSAGTHPNKVHPMSTAVMAEDGIDISEHTSDFIDDYLDTGIDIVITVCDNANQLCPTFPSVVKRIHWSIDDPFVNWSDEEHLLQPHRRARDKLRTRIQKFVSSRD